MRQAKADGRAARKFHRWLCGFTLLTLTLLGGIFAANVYYDPYLVFVPASALPTTANGIRNVLSSYSYVMKAVQIVREKPAYILLGTSVTDGGFRTPGSMANHYEPDPELSLKLQRLIDPHPPIYNAAIRGKNISEAYEYLQHAYLNNPQLKEVYLGLDWTMFTKQQQESLATTVSLLGHTHVTLDFLLQHSLSWSSTKLAFDMWRVDHGDIVSWVLAASSRLSTLWRTLLPDALAAGSPQFAPRPGQDVNHVLRGDYEFQVHNFIFTAWFVPGLKGAVKYAAPDAVTYPGFDSLRKIIAFCRDRHIQLTVFITPKHPFFWVFTEHFGILPYPESWLKQLVRITPVWDFSGAVDFGRSPDSFFQLDSLHFIHTGGELILPELLRGRPARTGVTIVTSSNVDQVISAYRKGITGWESTHPALTRSIYAISEKALDALDWKTLPNHIPLMPVVYEPDYMGYRIFKCMGRFLAVPVARADNLSLTDVMRYQEYHWPSADSLEGLITQLDGRGT